MQSETINHWLTAATKQLKDVGITSARLDAEIILAHTLNRSRMWLHAHSDESFDAGRQEIADTRILLRRDHTPIAYITGHKEFYGHPFKVTPSTLIPRPESENLIELLKRYVTPRHTTLIDVGTGSGCLGITAKLEFSHLSVTLSDISRHALTIAKQNAETLHAEVETVESDLLPPSGQYSIIVANLPYVDHEWERNKETDFEPPLALFAENDGRALIEQLIDQASNQLIPGGLLLLEADPRQMNALRLYGENHGFEHVVTHDFSILFRTN